ncbi:DEAD/DEAH box helicase [Novosphingobium rosa]|uniref:DEAD/DEAH box helicase n=1 Tax=Novosphingobium rosa TaxID=76978 RepID=UPI0008366A37|nr:DEAD/DEAH box helicase [Novosphingobium rosa]
MTTAFDKLARPIQRWIRSQGWRDLRDIQVRSITAISDGTSDVIIAASTAGGKTEAAFLPLISQVIADEEAVGGFDLLYVAPLKALITDQANRLEAMCQEAELPVVPWHGDVSASIKARAVKRPRGVLLITPESLEALFMRRGLEIPRLFRSLRAVILDEVHTMLDSERGVQLRSQLTRLELAIGRPIRRIGLSATLGDMDQARIYLRPDNAASVQVIEAQGGEAELRLQLRGYIAGGDDKSLPPPTDLIAKHLFDHLRGTDNLAFAGSRQSVEIYADRLRALCEDARLPQEFYPHHASLSREHREAVERRLKDGKLPTTAICTSTLELGIDIGDVSCVAQIGAPFSVASLRQRLGRSGRRAGKPAILRQYAIEAKINAKSSFADRLRLGLLRSIAMIDLLLEGWCEPARTGALHLSTLVHQILSIITERGGANAPRLYRMLCQDGPFRQVSPAIFADVLRAMGQCDPALIEQASDGLLLLGPMGESLTSHYSFYAVFQTPEEYRLIAEGRELGTLPIDNMVAPGMMIIFSGRRWLVQEVDDQGKVIIVTHAKAGAPPIFGGDAGMIHDVVIERMFDLLNRDDVPSYLDPTARELLAEARSDFSRMQFPSSRIAEIGEGAWIVATHCGTVKTTTLAFALRSRGFTVQTFDGFLEVMTGRSSCDLVAALGSIAEGAECHLFAADANLTTEKFHPYLTQSLLEMDALSFRLDQLSLPSLARSVLGLPSEYI